MLLLARQVGQEIVIGDDIVIKVVSIKGSYQVCVGIQAPKHIPVFRREISDRIAAEKAAL